MKRILALTAAAVMTLGAWAQNEYFHVFRNDDDFSSYKGADVQSVTVAKGTTDFSTMIVTETDGTVTKIPMSAIDSCQVRPYGLPEIYVYLTDYPDLTDLIKNPSAGFDKNTIYAATLHMDGNGMYKDLAEQTVEFRGRGNSTWNMDKTPYRFKMAKKAAVCDLPKAKTFALIANYIDCTLMRNTVALWVANYLEMPYANHCVPVRVYLNDNFKGQYMLTEKIGIGGGSVDIDEYKGLLFELDSNYDEDFKFRYTWNSGGWQSYNLPVMVKDPDLTEICDSLGVTASEYFSKWQSDFTTMANAVTSRSASESLADVLDLDQAADFFLVNALANNHEMKHPKSLYIHKDSIGGDARYKFGPVWDFDWAFTYDGESYDGEQASATAALVTSNGDCSGYSFLKCLFANNEFRTIFKAKLDAFVADGYPKLQAYMEEYANLIEPSAKENGLLWPGTTNVSWRKTVSSWNFRSNFAKLKTWIANRVAYMQSHKNYGLYE